jgi:ribosomal protein S18 acetylase RimI-like enzyme
MGGVDPAHRRRGHGTALLGWQIEGARRLLLAQPAELPRFIRTMAFDFERDAIALYQRHGLTAVRTTDEMLRPLAELPTAPAPDGVELVPWDEARTEELRALHNEAFADQWGTSTLDAAAWRHRLDQFGTRLDLSFVALAGGRAVGFAMNGHFPGDRDVTGRLDGWVQQLGTARAWRKRGVASALLAASCRAFAAAGLDHAMLAVDSDSLTGAQRLYERLGFRRLHRSIVHQLTV